MVMYLLTPEAEIARRYTIIYLEVESVLGLCNVWSAGTTRQRCLPLG